MTDTLTREDVDLEEHVDDRLQCQFGEPPYTCPHLVHWMVYVSCCGGSAVLCTPHKEDFEEWFNEQETTWCQNCGVEDVPIRFTKI